MKLFALLISMASAIGFLGVPGAALAADAAKPAVVFAAQDSGMLRPGQDLAIGGTISNTTTEELPAGTATAYINRGVLSSRSDLADWTTSGDAVATDKLGTALGSVTTPAIAPGHTVFVAIAIPAAAIGLSADAAWGTRTIAVQVAAGGSNVGQSRSSIVWNSSGAFTPVSLALAMPLTVPASTDGLIPSATLATYTAPGGLLSRELSDAVDRHIAIGIDPMIIASIRILGSSAPASARDWLLQLQAATNETFPLTYADSDVAATRQSGVQSPLAPTSFTIDPRLFPGFTPAPTASPTVSPTPDPTTTAPPTLWTTQTITDWAYTPSLAGLVWPSDDTVVEADLDAFAVDGFSTTILSSSNVSYGDTDHTPSAAAVVDKQSALISDAQISELFRAAVAAPDDVSWQKAMADLSAGIALVAAQRGGGDERQLLATLGRNNPADNLRLPETMQSLATLPWAGFTKLADVAASASPIAATVNAKPESSGRIATVTSLIASENAVGSFASVLEDPTMVTGERRLSLLAVLANSWNEQLPAWNTAAKKYTKASTKILDSVNIARTGSQLLPSDTVNLQVSVTNDLDWPVVVYVTVTSPSGVIQVEKSGIKLTIEANSQAKAAVPVRALANGDVSLRASLASATDVPIGHPRVLDVNVQAGWETALTAVVAVLVALVFGFGIYRNIVKRRRRKRGAADPEDTPTDAETPKAL